MSASKTCGRPSLRIAQFSRGGNPTVDCLRDDIVEWMEFYSTAADRLGSSLQAAEQALARGEMGSALYYLRNAKVTHSLLATGLAKATAELTAT